MSSQVTDKALGRLVFQFRNSSKLRAFGTAFLDEFEELYISEQQLLTERYLDTSVGVQLDGIGAIVGLERPIGYADDLYRYLIRVKILINSTDMTADNFLELIAFVFENSSAVIEYQLTVNLSPNFIITGTLSDEEKIAVTLLPNTLGIEIIYTHVVDPAETFSFDGDPTGKGFGTTTDPTKGGNFASIISP